MGKNIVVLASGRTELGAIPELTRSFCANEGAKVQIRIPPSGVALLPSVVEKLAKAAWWEMKGRGQPPDKFIVLIDADGKSTSVCELPFQESCQKLADLPVPFFVTSAQWHLEAWFFGHAEALRVYLGRDLGSVDTSQPDAMANPKLHLKHLLKSPYTARVAAEIAAHISSDVVAQRSESYSRFNKCLRNGDSG